MYLSRLILNPRSRRTQSELSSVYELHRSIMRAFPSHLSDDERVLFRVDIDRITGVPTVLVQSQDVPDWSFFDGEAGYLLDTGECNPACKRFEPTLRAGQLLAFRLRANPTVKRDGRRVAWFDETDQLDWLRRKADQHGFRVVSATVTPEGFVDTRKSEGGTRHSVRHYAVRYDGHIQVVDSQACVEAIASGIGPAKAFGFGLLSLAGVR